MSIEEATSKNLRGATELTLIADIKKGFVPVSDTLTYGRRLRRTLNGLLALRKETLEVEPLDKSAGALEHLRMLRFFHWSVIDDDRRLLLAVSFDGPWEPYIRGIADLAGPLIDIIFCHCEGYEGHTSRDGFSKFTSWIRPRQINCDLIYAADPELTTDDVRYLKEFERLYAERDSTAGFPRAAAALSVGAPAGPDRDARRYFTLLTGMARLRPDYAADAGDAAIFDRMARALSRDIDPGLPAGTPVPGVSPLILGWAAQLRAHDPKPLVPAPDADLGAAELGTIQGNILSGYPGMTHGCLVLLQFDSLGEGADFLEQFTPTTETAAAPSDGVRQNIAFTLHGLKTLGCDDQVIHNFPREFRDGLAARATLLGLIGPSHPGNWALPRRNWPAEVTPDPVPLETVDAVVILQTAAPHVGGDHLWTPRHPLYAEVAQRLGGRPGVRILSVEPLRRASVTPPRAPVREHFGYADGISQPVPRIKGRVDGSRPQDRVALGELLLGHPNDRGELATIEDAPELVQNGSFLVVTKMSQNVAAFEAFAKGHGTNSEDRFKAKLLGRYPDGTALIGGHKGNDFNYRDDPLGEQCPRQAHIRRANPRAGRQDDPDAASLKPPSPRIMRRGFSYGPARDDQTSHDERGIMFMAYNASIADQFEVIQRWINGGNSTGALSAHGDLVAGVTPPRGRRHADLHGVPRFLVPPEPFVRVLWGMYLFVPSTTGIGALLHGDARPAAGDAGHPPRRMLSETPSLPGAAPDPQQEAGEKILKRLAALPDDEAADGWKRLLEDAELRAEARAVWSAIRARGGVLPTPYGLLVGSAAEVESVLKGENLFSAREYWRRMKTSFGETFLGMDHCPRPSKELKSSKPPPEDDYEAKVPAGRYQQEATLPNQYIYGITRDQSFLAARSSATAALAALAARSGPVRPFRVDLVGLAFRVLGDLVGKWFGLPDPSLMAIDGNPGDPPAPAQSQCPSDFLKVSRLIFGPRPGPSTTAIGSDRGRAIRAASLSFVQSSPVEAQGPFLKYLRDAGYCDGDQDALARAWAGALSGFVAPTFGSFVSVMSGWIASKELWRMQQLLQSPSTPGDWADKLMNQDQLTDGDVAGSPLARRLTAAMMAAPVPSLLHREAVENVSIKPAPPCAAGPNQRKDLLAGAHVVVGLGSAAEESDSPEFLFGGQFGATGALPHACPGRGLAEGVLLGLLVALLKQPNLKVFEGLPLNLTFG